MHVLEAMKRVFYYILKSEKTNRSIYSIVRKHNHVSLVEECHIKEFDNLDDYEKGIYKSVKAFDSKKKKLRAGDPSNKIENFLRLSKAQSFRESAQNP
jgi:hypothetical protein